MKSKNTRMRISITILPTLNKLLEEISKSEKISKSSLVEKLIEMHLSSKLKSEAKKLAKMKFDDLPTEDEWLLIQKND